MARFRTLDPAMRDSPMLDDLSLLALLLIDRLIQEADDEGRQFGDPRSVWRAAFPRDNAPTGVTRESVTAALDELVRRRIIIKYEVEGQAYLALPGWRDGRSWQYQNVSRAKPSRFPAPPKGTCPVVDRGHGAPPAGRAENAVSDCPATSHGAVAGDVDVDRTGRGREADADADRTGRRASPSPSPAGAGAGEARPKDMTKAVGETPNAAPIGPGFAAFREAVAAVTAKCAADRR
jgi:hypothetical protein